MSRPNTNRRLNKRRAQVYAGSPAPWTPANLTLPRIASFEQQFTDDGGGICSAWIEQVAAKNATATTTARPNIVTVGSKQVLDFDGSSDFLFTSPATITGGQDVVTFACIVNADSVSGVRKIVESGSGGAGSFAIFLESARLSVYAGGAAGQDYVAGNTPISTATTYLFVVEIPWNTLSTAEIKSWVNGTQQTQTVIGNTATNTTFGTKTWIIGRWISAGLQFWDGKMMLLDVWDGAFTAQEQTLFYLWAQREYGVV